VRTKLLSLCRPRCDPFCISLVVYARPTHSHSTVSPAQYSTLQYSTAPCTWLDVFGKTCSKLVLWAEDDGFSAPWVAACSAEARARVVHMFMKAFGIDELTASYYLEEARGNVRAASVLLRTDLEWERRQHTAGGR